MEYRVQIPDQVILQHDLVREEMRQDGEGSCVQLGESIAEVLVC